VTGSDAIDRTLHAIREQGGRVTDQRRAILEVLFDESDHVTAEGLAERVRTDLPEVHVTTVYRFLDTLEEMGLVTHVHLGHGPAAFHLTSHRHTHVVCDTCGQVGVIEPSMFDQWSAELERATGFRLTDQHFALATRCRRCSLATSAGDVEAG
jgi:Fur family transcriptional regulator, ferric uptake regulator